MIRPATPADVPRMVELVHELADYEREPASCLLTEEQLHAALFRGEPGANGSDSIQVPALFGHVAVDAQPDLNGTAGTGEVVGMALWFRNFSTWRGVHGIYLEDLYVRPAFRGRGHGRALLATLAGIATERGYGRLEWAVLNWNTPAQAFYRSLGAGPTEEWMVWRLTGEALASLGSAGRP